jgi:hypothetical protein
VPPSLSWATHDGVDWLVLGGLSSDTLTYLDSQHPAELARALPVLPSAVVDAGRSVEGLQPMPGRYAVTAGEVRFAPRFPFLAGTSYTMMVGHPGTGGARTRLEIERPAAIQASSTEVVTVYPMVAVLPRNALRFYLHFSGSMSEGLAARHVHLESESGERIFGAFSPMDFELWDPARRRLTVLLDPARIKQGLAPHQEAGYPLKEGSAVVLVVEREFCDAAGLPMVSEYRRRYEVGPDMRSLVDPSAWALEVPDSGGRRPLVARFDRPLDRALLEDCLAVVGPGGVVAGEVQIAAGEQSWSFVPDGPWTPGPNRILIDPVLEDIAGNSVVRIFDRDLHQPDQEPRAVDTVALAFDVGGP